MNELNKSNTVFTPGDVVIANTDYGYNVVKDKEYVVTKYEPPYPEPGTSFTWPAYVTVTGDHGKPVTGHTYRFRKKEY